MAHSQSVIFDCDSTLSALEGIDTLGRESPPEVLDEVRALTQASMAGTVPLEDVYGRRLKLIRPARDEVAALVPRYIDGLVDHARDTVTALREADVEVRIISGGLLPAVQGLARHLGLSDDAVSAVPIHFADDGSFAGFDPVPATRAGGKPEVIRAWKEQGLPGPVLFVGDGATDLEAIGDVDLFVAFAGVVERPEVTGAAPVVIRAPSLAPVVPLALGEDRPTAGVARAVFDTGKSLIGRGMVEWR